MINNKGYDGAKADLWSCGVILFVLMAGYLPFEESNLMALYKKVIFYLQTLLRSIALTGFCNDFTRTHLYYVSLWRGKYQKYFLIIYNNMKMDKVFDLYYKSVTIQFNTTADL